MMQAGASGPKNARPDHSFRLARVVGIAVVVNCIASCALLALPANPYDFAGITGSANAFLAWGVSPWLHWNFGSSYMAFDLLANGAARVLVAAHVPEPIALHATFKLPLVICNIASGLLLLALARRLRWPHPDALAVTWLINPVPILVAGYWGQIEPVVVCALLLAIVLSLQGRWFYAGLVAGLGAGFEYVSLAFVLIVVVLFLGKRLPVTHFLTSGLGTIIGLTASFGPVMLAPIGRGGLRAGVFGLAASGQAFKAKEGSLWSVPGLGGTALERHWSLVFIGVCLVLVAAGVREVRSNSPTQQRAFPTAIAVCGLALSAAVILDPLINPQFAALVLVGLLLVAGPWQPWRLAVAALPLASIIAYFFSASFYLNFLDVDHAAVLGTQGLLPVPGVSNAISSRLSLVLPLMVMVACCLWVAQAFTRAGFREVSRGNASRGKWDRRLRLVAATSAIGVLAVVGVWSNQGALWRSAVDHPYGYLFDTPYFTSRAVASVTRITGDTVSATFSRADLAAAEASSIPGTGALEFVPRNVVYSNAATVAIHGSITEEESVPLAGRGIRVTAIEVQLLAYKRTWRSGHPSAFSIRCGTHDIRSSTSLVVVAGWAIGDFVVPTSRCGLDPTGQAPRTILRFETVPGTLLLNGGGEDKPWIRIWYAQGWLRCRLGERHAWAPFSGSSNIGLGRIVVPLSTLTAGQTISCDGLAAVGTIQDVAIVWPDPAVKLDRTSVWTGGLALLYLAAIAGGLGSVGLALRRGKTCRAV
ncbi:MAG: hypothetical protein ACYDC5_05170 [Candidatus Dormibacteria bacterium]